MLNIGGGELMVIALIGLITLGPEPLPAMMRKTGALSAQVRGMKDELVAQFVAATEARTGTVQDSTGDADTINDSGELLPDDVQTTNGPSEPGTDLSV